MKNTPHLVCILCGQIALEESYGGGAHGWNHSPTCIANAGGAHIDPDTLSDAEIEAVLAMRRKWLNP